MVELLYQLYMENNKEDNKSIAAAREEVVLEFWKNQDIFNKTLEKESKEGEFVFYEGPPTANGMPGIHHLEARAFKDAIPRYKTMRGYHVRRKGGWDTHGLPVELQVEKKLGLNSKKAIEEYGIVSKEYFKYTAADGITQVDGFFLKPKNFDVAKKYPVMVYQYSGPRSTNTTNSFGGGSFWWHQMLTQKGIIVAVVDTRGNGSRGEKFAKMTYKQLGKYETEDLVAGGKYLGTLPYVDKSRLAIWGWSFGGYTTSLVMTKGAGTYKVGIAGAPVTSWRYYDNLYTERFLQRPQENAAGYDENSPTKYADKLQGDFLLIHGTGDDNVHFQNSVALEDALINAGKQFRSHFYPDQPHGFRGGKVNLHRFTLMTDFLLEHL